jgi:hypothetical protein
MYAFQHGIIASANGGGVNPLWDGLLAYYTADNTPNDATGNGNNGTLVNGATYGTGIINQGFSFDGVNDYINMGNVLDFDGSTPFSFSFWVNPTTVGNRNIINKLTEVNNGYIIYFLNDRLEFGLSNNTPSNLMGVRTNATYTTGMQHFTVSYDGSKSPSGISIVHNGINQTLTTIVDTLTGSISTTADFSLGRNLSSVGWFNGIIDELAVFSKELTLSESVELYNSGAGLQYTP